MIFLVLFVHCIVSMTNQFYVDSQAALPFLFVAGHVIGYDKRSGPISTTEQSVNMLSEYLELDPPLAPITEVANTLLALKETDAITEGYSSVGSTNVALNGERADVRGRETNLGRLAAGELKVNSQ